MAMQIDKGSLRKYIKQKEKKFSKRLHKREKRRQLKNINNPSVQYNRYTGGWCM